MGFWGFPYSPNTSALKMEMGILGGSWAYRQEGGRVHEEPLLGHFEGQRPVRAPQHGGRRWRLNPRQGFERTHLPLDMGGFWVCLDTARS